MEQVYRRLTEEEELEAVVTEIELRAIPFCQDYRTWTRVALALAADLGESGRDYFHRLSRLDQKYHETQCDKKYDNALRTARGTGLGAFFCLAKQQGIDLAEVYRKAERSPQHTSTPPIHPLRAAQTAPEATLKALPLNYITDRSEAGRASENTLAAYLAPLFGLEEVTRALTLYHIGSERGRAVFPQIDTEGRLRNAKIIAYKPDGHRDKQRAPQWLLDTYVRDTTCLSCPQGAACKALPWAEAAERYRRCERVAQAKAGYGQCLFGEHLLAINPDKLVGVVEAEKTALICSMQYPQHVWVATGGITNLSPQRLQTLRGRGACFFPDADAITDWQQRLAAFQEPRWCLSTKWATNEKPDSKRDVADLILAEREARRRAS
ncbi:MAG: DUF6371 domain-containing protein [Prevotellaceae bacterium]|nr:DUF6371 domain-containing protein [Prevotellaceae bacterium]